MVNARPHREPTDPPLPPLAGRGRGRFHVLLTEDDHPRGDEHWTRQFPRLLEPMGIQAHIARCGEEAIDLAAHVEFHAAVIDLATPKAGTGGERTTPGGLWLLELFRRLPHRPPTVVVTTRRYAARDIDRFLREALRLGAFSVIHQPVDLERMLTVFRSLVDRQYRGTWPSDPRP